VARWPDQHAFDVRDGSGELLEGAPRVGRLDVEQHGAGVGLVEEGCGGLHR
jgi:hypothetical protein